ncbi:MAG TPA: sulfite exporter TauE/SafE family protein [Dongiaceae bacterium]
MAFALGDTSIWDFLVIGAAAFAAGTCSGMTGFGGGLLLPPILASILGVQHVVPVMSFAMLITNVHRLTLYRRHADLKLIGLVLLTIVPAVVLGTTIYLGLPPHMISIVLGSFLLLSIPVGRFFARRKLRLGPAGLSLAGGCLGIISGTTPGAGMLMVPVLLGVGLVGEAFLATDASISIAVNLTKAVIFNRLGGLPLGLLGIGLVIGVCTVPGNYAARWILRRTLVRLHTRQLEAVVLIGGLSLLLQPLWQPSS